jgi:hypothetical protein
MFRQAHYTSGKFRGIDGWLKGHVEAGISFCFINSTQTEDARIRPPTHQQFAILYEDRLPLEALSPH